MQRVKTLGFFILLSLGLALTPSGAAETDTNAEKLLNQAKDLISRQNNATQAAILLKDGVKQFPKDYRFWVTLGVAFEAMNDLEKAISAYKSALEIKIVPGLSTRVLGLENKVVMGKAFQAFMIEEQKRTSRKLSPKELFDQALKDRAEKKFDSAFEKFIECVSQDPGYLGLNDKGIIKSALAYYQDRVSEKAPNSQYYLAIYYFFAGNVDEAIKGLQKFIREEPGSKLNRNAIERLKSLEELKARLKSVAQQAEIASQTPRIASRTISVNRIPASGTAVIASGPTPIFKTPTILELSDSKEVQDLFSEAQEMKSRKQMGKASALMQAALNKKKDPKMLMEYADLNFDLAKKGNPVATRAAIFAWQEILEKFPDSPLANEAKTKILSLQPTPAKRGEEIDKHFANNEYVTEDPRPESDRIKVPPPETIDDDENPVDGTASATDPTKRRRRYR